MNIPHRFTLVGLALVALAAACGTAPTATPTPSPTPRSAFGLPPLTLPADEAPHDFQTEWWYFNAQVSTQTGQRFVLHDVVFQIRASKSSQTVYVRQIGFGDVANGVHVDGERLNVMQGTAPAPPNGFQFNMGNWVMSGSDGKSYHLLASAGNYSYALSLTTTSAPLLHGQDGLVGFGPAGVSYYYSRPWLTVKGTVTMPSGQQLAVTGLGWMDKQWGNFQPVEVGWDWASVQLDDGAVLMLSRLFDMQGNLIKLYGTYRAPSGTEEHLTAGQIEFTPLNETWTSPQTGITYKIRWQVRIPSKGLEFTLVPLIKDSEFVSQTLGVTYWEGGMEVNGADGHRLGQGFVELNWPRQLFTTPTP